MYYQPELIRRWILDRGSSATHYRSGGNQPAIPFQAGSRCLRERHTFSSPHLTVLLTAGKVRATQDGQTMIVSHQPGDSFWMGAITHETENIGSNEVRALIIEVKSTGSQ